MRSRTTRNVGRLIILIGLVLLIIVLGYALRIPIICDLGITSTHCTRILFIGNSYTYANDLPGTFARLAGSGGHTVEAEMAAEGSWTLADHASSTQTLNKLASKKWDIVVLQEQSQIPALASSREQQMFPAAQALVNKINQVGAKSFLFMTWAHQSGWPEAGLPDYQSMQGQIDGGYIDLSKQLNIPVAPVGYAWMMALNQDTQLGLWQEDGSHPDQAGTYLAACVFYAAIFQESPVGLTYLDGLTGDEAGELQAIASDAVLANPQEWNLPQ